MTVSEAESFPNRRIDFPMVKSRRRSRGKCHRRIDCSSSLLLSVDEIILGCCASGKFSHSLEQGATKDESLINSILLLVNCCE